MFLKDIYKQIEVAGFTAFYPNLSEKMAIDYGPAQDIRFLQDFIKEIGRNRCSADLLHDCDGFSLEDAVLYHTASKYIWARFRK